MIRDATPADIAALMALGEGFHAAHGYEGADVDWDRMPGLLRYLIDDPDGLVLVLERDGAIVGALIGMAHRPLFGRRRQASELGFWIAPDARGAETLRMIPRFEAWARDRDCAVITLSGFCDERAEKIARAYGRYGFAARETTYSKAL